MFLKTVILLICTTSIKCAQNARIFGGQQRVEPGEFPYNALINIRVLLSTQMKTSCGSILAPKWILVAAHSVYDDIASPNLFEVIAGRYDLLQWTGTEQVRRVQTVIRHPEYNHAVKGFHDIALLLLTTSLSYNEYVQPVSLVSNLEYPLGAVGMVTGYGVIQPSGTTASYLSKLSVNILTPETCSNGDASWNTNLICTDPGTCEGDSGAPLFLRNGDQWSQIGLISFGFQCAFYGTPAYYTSVPQYLNWINETIVTTNDDDNGSKRTAVPLMGIIVVTCSKIIIGFLAF
ncbi:coagulation factor IX-like [Armigeres subalbatus]|uniref:coagulation factor IX-like n=1 Tax=Armigeres subalbatus TaxID=124917 RepID=UPI002ED19635